MQLGPERFRAAEVLFQPDLIGLEVPGVHEMIINSIQLSDMDLRKTLYSNIVLAGGSTLFRGMLAPVFGTRGGRGEGGGQKGRCTLFLGCCCCCCFCCHWFWLLIHSFAGTRTSVGFGERLLSEIKHLAPSDCKIRISVRSVLCLCFCVFAFYCFFFLKMKRGVGLLFSSPVPVTLGCDAEGWRRRWWCPC